MTHSNVSLVSIDDEVVAGHLQELRRGTVVVACLVVAAHAPTTATRCSRPLARAGFAVDANTLYPAAAPAARSRGCSTSEWNTEEARPRKFYRTSADGVELLATLRDDWRALDSAITDLT